MSIEDNVMFLDKCDLKIKYRTMVEVLLYLGSGRVSRPKHGHHCWPGTLKWGQDVMQFMFPTFRLIGWVSS